MKVILPENISEITLSQFQRFEKLSQREDLDDYEFNKRKIEIFTDIKYHDLDGVSQRDFVDVLDIIDKALSVDVPFKNTFTMNGVEFGFIPNLDKIQTKEYVDLRAYDTEVETLHKLMAVLFRPITYKDTFGNYKIARYKGTEKYAELMKAMPFNIVSGSLVFFYNLSKELQTSIQRYTEQELVRGVKHQDTLKNGGGTQPSAN